MIALNGVSKSYSHQSKVLDHIDLEVEKGSFLYLLGGSGAGKTSLLRLLATEEVPTEGCVSLFGYDLSRIPKGTLQNIRRSVGYIPQKPQLIPDLTVWDHVVLSLKLGGAQVQRDATSRASQVIEALDLIHKKEKKIRELSGGETQRVAVASALVRAPELILADEPTGAQDREHTWSLMELFVKTHLKGATVVIATHDRDIVRRVRKRCLLLKEGKLTVSDSLCIY